MRKRELLTIQKQAEEWAKEAGKILQQYQDKAKIKKRKSDFGDIVTDADFVSEQFLINKIQQNFPNHNILSEEVGIKEGKSAFTWIIDPLDGTKEYIRGLPTYNISLTLEHKEKLVIGIVYLPITNELFSTSRGNGAFLNQQRIEVSKEDLLKNSFIWSHLPTYKTPKKDSVFTWKVLAKLTSKVYRLRASSQDVVTLSRLAQGSLEGFVLTFPRATNWWDFAPGLLMVEEAGGKVTDIYGNKIKNRDLSKGIVASNGKIHEKLLEFLKT